MSIPSLGASHVKFSALWSGRGKDDDRPASASSPLSPAEGPAQDEVLIASSAPAISPEDSMLTPPQGLTLSEHLFDLAGDFRSQQRDLNAMYSQQPGLADLLKRYDEVLTQAAQIEKYPDDVQEPWQNAVEGVTRDLDGLMAELFKLDALDRPYNEQTEERASLNQARVRTFINSLIANQARIPNIGPILQDLFGRVFNESRDFATTLAYDLLQQEAKDDKLPMQAKVALVNAAGSDFVNNGDSRLQKPFKALLGSVETDSKQDWQVTDGARKLMRAQTQLDQITRIMDAVKGQPRLTRAYPGMQNVLADVQADIDYTWGKLSGHRVTPEIARQLAGENRPDATPGVKKMVADLERLSSPFSIGGLT